MKTHRVTGISFRSMVMLTPAYGSEAPEMLEVKQPVVEKQLEVVISRSEERPEQSMRVVVRVGGLHHVLDLTAGSCSSVFGRRLDPRVSSAYAVDDRVRELGGARELRRLECLQPAEEAVGEVVHGRPLARRGRLLQYAPVHEPHGK